jgi:hypothetical protein
MNAIPTAAKINNIVDVSGNRDRMISKNNTAAPTMAIATAADSDHFLKVVAVLIF